jgi:hypothetical protein
MRGIHGGSLRVEDRKGGVGSGYECIYVSLLKTGK